MSKVKKAYHCPDSKESLNQLGNNLKASFYNLITFRSSKAKMMYCTRCMKSYVVHEANMMQFLTYKKSEKQ